MKFDTSTGPEPLDYDFTGYGVDAAGRVPEPTQEALGTFLDYFEALAGENQKASEKALQERANAIQAELETDEASITVIGDLPGPAPDAEPAPVSEPSEPPAPELEKRTWRQIILGDDKKSREYVDMIAGLCQQQPTGDQIWALPPRIRGAFNQMTIDLFVFGKDDQGKAAAGSNS